MKEQELRYFVFASIISAENDSLTEEVKQSIISRHKEEKQTNKTFEQYNWEYILEPLNDEDAILRITKLLKDGKR